jgi:signal transduction histidine kinase
MIIFILILSLLLIYIIICYIRGYKIKINYRTKILITLLSLSILPVVILWFYTENFITEQNTRTTIRQLNKDIDIVVDNLLRYFSGQIDSISLKSKLDLFEARKIADNTGRDFNIYLGDSMIISSSPEIYKTELVSKFISPLAYSNIILKNKNFFTENLSIGNFPYIVGYEPIVSKFDNVIGILSVPILYKNSITDKELAQSLAFIFGIYSIIVFLIVALGSYLSNKISLPIKNLTKATKQIRDGDLESKIPSSSKDEIGELITSFNEMRIRLKESQKEIARIERELAWKEMAKQVAHEIKNPLTPMKLSVQHLQQLFKDKTQNFENSFNRITKTLIEQIEALSNIASEFSNFAKMPRRIFQDCAINELIQNTVNLYKEEKNIDFDINFYDNIPTIKADSEELRRVFINIIRNSIQAINHKQPLKGKIEIQTLFQNNKIIIKIKDNGIGIPDKYKHKLFEPNFSTKSDGMGLGLAISKKTIEDLHGEINIFSEETKGTEVQIII